MANSKTGRAIDTGDGWKIIAAYVGTRCACGHVILCASMAALIESVKDHQTWRGLPANAEETAARPACGAVP